MPQSFGSMLAFNKHSILCEALEDAALFDALLSIYCTFTELQSESEVPENGEIRKTKTKIGTAKLPVECAIDCFQCT